MKLITRLCMLAAVAAAVAGCASTPPVPGKHLVYRDASGNATRQFDYPDDAFCRRVEQLAGRAARCQPQAASGLTAKATLRYSPPGVLVEGHYQDMNRCRADTGSLPPGVQLINPCTAK